MRRIVFLLFLIFVSIGRKRLHELLICRFTSEAFFYGEWIIFSFFSFFWRGRDFFLRGADESSLFLPTKEEGEEEGREGKKSSNFFTPYLNFTAEKFDLDVIYGRGSRSPRLVHFH